MSQKLEELQELLNRHKESDEEPKMIEILVEGRSYQNAFCFALVLEDRGAREPLMLCTVIGGPDSTLQSIKAAIDMGTYGLSYGYGKKGLSSYQFHKELSFFTEKGKYHTFPMTVNNRKVMAIVHDDIMEGKYTMSFESSPAYDVRKVLGGKQYGIPLLDEWSETIYQELKKEQYIVTMPAYADKGIFPEGFHVIRFDFSEEQADEFISKMIKEGKISFPEEGTGEELEKIETLTDYMQGYSEQMIEKLSEQIHPTHNPLVDEAYPHFESYNMKLFPVQAHVATAIAKRLRKQKSVILQGEMSTGKSKMMTAIADAYHHMKGKKGYFACVMVPPSLTDKWSKQEIYDLLPEPRSKVIHIKDSAELIQFHSDWVRQGRPKPEVPTFFVISFTTMRSGAAIEPAVEFQYKKTKKQSKLTDGKPYRFGYICPDCGRAHQVIESKNNEIDENGNDKVHVEKRVMLEEEFGVGRRIHNSAKPANAFCSECGASLWTYRVPTRYSSFKEWVTELEAPLLAAIKAGDKIGIRRIQKEQKPIKKLVGKPRKVAAIEYIRRKMKNFFDICIIDEVHELKGGVTAQGNALGALVSASKRCIAGTGTLFGGKAEDIYYIMWRLFPYEMVKAGYRYSEVTKWNHEFGNIERTTYSIENDNTEYTNKQSRGGKKPPQEKVKPGISPFVFGRFLIQNTCLVTLANVWPDPVELVDVPTIFVDMTDEMKQAYEDMKRTFELEIEANRYRKEDHISNLWLLYTETGVAYPDNPEKYPEVWGKTKAGERKLIWEPKRISMDKLLPKEKKLVEILKSEISESRPTIIYVRDTGSTNKDRDIQPRLQKIIEENVDGAKVAILRPNTVATDQRSKWLKNKVEREGVNVIICSMELVKVGLDLIVTPTIIFYQFSWSMFTMSQASRRAWRIGQTRECRLYYLAYADSFQEYMAKIIAQKNKASQAINGNVSSDGLNSMLGDDGDLQSLLIKSIKNGETLKGTTEEWIATTTERAREILAGIGKTKSSSGSELIAQLINWAKQKDVEEVTLDAIRKNKELIIANITGNKVNGFSFKNGVLTVDEILAFGLGFFTDSDLISHLLAKKPKAVNISDMEVKLVVAKPSKKTKNIVDGQLAIDLFGEF
jgi:hypothetical protein